MALDFRVFLLISRYCGSAGSSEVIAALANPDLGALDGTASSLSAGLNGYKKMLVDLLVRSFGGSFGDA